MAVIEFLDVVKVLGGREVLRGISLTVGEGELLALVGPSGSGKTTLLRLLAGLDTPTAGEIRIGGRRVNDLPPKARNVAMVFQTYALYPHLSVADNIGFPLAVAGVPKAAVAAQVAKAAALLGLSDKLERFPRQLSGGERQRVAMGRAIVREPDAFLFDEPLSNLDARLRLTVRAELRDLHRRLGTTTLHVTHDQTEATAIADRVAVLNAGRIEQIGTPVELYDRPANLFVASFIGTPPMNLIPGVITGEGGAATFRPLAGGEAAAVVVGNEVVPGAPRPAGDPRWDAAGRRAEAEAPTEASPGGTARVAVSHHTKAQAPVDASINRANGQTEPESGPEAAGAAIAAQGGAEAGLPRETMVRTGDGSAVIASEGAMEDAGAPVATSGGAAHGDVVRGETGVAAAGRAMADAAGLVATSGGAEPVLPREDPVRMGGASGVAAPKRATADAVEPVVTSGGAGTDATREDWLRTEGASGRPHPRAAVSDLARAGGEIGAAMRDRPLRGITDRGPPQLSGGARSAAPGPGSTESAPSDSRRPRSPKPATAEDGTAGSAAAWPLPDAPPGNTVTLGVRPESVILGEGVAAVVRLVEPAGADTLVVVRAGATELSALSRARLTLRPGDTVAVGFDPAAVHLFDTSTGARLKH